MAKPGYRGMEWERFRQKVFAQYGHTCHLCGHGGARDVDHLRPGTHSRDVRDYRPAHGVMSRCGECGRACNQARRDLSVEDAQRQISEQARSVSWLGTSNADRKAGRRIGGPSWLPNGSSDQR